jgi:hypothetical protein
MSSDTPEPTQLPTWTAAANVAEVAILLNDLGTTRLESYYVCGKHLIWAKDQVGHKNFTNWVEDHIKAFSLRTAERYMRYAKLCDDAGKVLHYGESDESDEDDENDNLTNLRDDLFDGNRVLTVAEFIRRVKEDLRKVPLTDYADAAHQLLLLAAEIEAGLSQERADMTGATFAEQEAEIIEIEQTT